MFTPTHFTNVRFVVGVFATVKDQTGRICKALGTKVTSEGFVSCVDVQMALELLPLKETLFTHLTLEISLTSVLHHVRNQNVFCFKTFFTHITLHWRNVMLFLMHPHSILGIKYSVTHWTLVCTMLFQQMYPEITFIEKRFFTKTATMSFVVARMNLHVPNQVGSFREFSTTNRTAMFRGDNHFSFLWSASFTRRSTTRCRYVS